MFIYQTPEILAAPMTQEVKKREKNKVVYISIM